MKSLALVALFVLAGRCGATCDINLALKKPAFQYSTWDSGTVAGKAVDGDITTHWRKCQATNWATDPWWAVDLDGIYTVTSLSIFLSSDCPQCLDNFHVVLSYTAPPASGPLPNIEAIIGSGLCIYQNESTQMDGKMSLACTSPRNGRYVYIIARTKLPVVLVMCEVEVFGRFAGPENLAMKKPAFQYNVYNDVAVAGNAVDGDLSTNAEKCQMTTLVKNPWWAVDLGGIYTVTSLSIREPGCPHCLNPVSNFDVVVSNTPPPASGPLSKIEAIKGSGLCIYQNGSTQMDGKMSLACTSPRKGRYVYIILRDMSKLTMCEVEVFGAPPVPPKTPVLTGFELAAVAVGSYRELVCDASQPDAGSITYTWYKYSTDSRTGLEDWESYGPIGKSQKYVFNPVVDNNRGKYKCRASNSIGTRDSEWGDLYVYKPCSLYSVSIAPAKPAIGSTFTLNCYIRRPSGLTVNWIKKADASSGPIVIATANSKGCHAPEGTRYSWMSTCSPPNFSSQPRLFNLQVYNAQPSDSAYWTCKDIGLSCESNPGIATVQE